MNSSEENEYTKIFSPEFDAHELGWHLDCRDSTLKVISSGGWSFQEENEVSIMLSDGDSISVKRYTFYRLIKGKGPLVVMITKVT